MNIVFRFRPASMRPLIVAAAQEHDRYGMQDAPTTILIDRAGASESRDSCATIAD